MASRLSPKAMAEPTMTMTRLAVLATLWEAAEAQGLTSAETHGRREAKRDGRQCDSDERACRTDDQMDEEGTRIRAGGDSEIPR